VKKILTIYLLAFCFTFCAFTTKAASLLIPMDEAQKDHLKSYGIAFWVLQKKIWRLTGCSTTAAAAL